MTGAQNNGGATGKGFRPGQSGNPGGRPKGLGAYIRAQTRDGEELVDIALEIVRSKANVRRRIEALHWLADRGWGKALESVDHRAAITVVVQRHTPSLAEGTSAAIPAVATSLPDEYASASPPAT